MTTDVVIRMAVGGAVWGAVSIVALNIVMFAWFVRVHWIEERREVAAEMAQAGIAPASVRRIAGEALHGLVSRQKVTL